MTIYLAVSYTALREFVVNKKLRYRNRNNPAVELIRQVIAHKTENAPTFSPHRTYEQYDKLTLLIDRPPHFLADKNLFRKYHFLFSNPDTSLVPGKTLVPVFIEETLSRNYQRTNPDRHKQIILGHRRVNLGQYIDIYGISAILNRIYQDFNIYDNSIPVYTQQFLSPIAGAAPEFYKYFIRDTIIENGIPIVHLDFSPRNPEDLQFNGYLEITLDGRYAIRKVELTVNKHINLNWVRNFRVDQQYQPGPDQHLFRTSSRLLTFMSPLPKSRGFYGEHILTTSNPSDSLFSDSIFWGLTVDTALFSIPRPDSFWTSQRPVSLTSAEASTYTNTDSLVKMRSYRHLMDWITFLTAGYKSAGKFEIGPVGSFFSSNSLEGRRYQFGGRTNTKFSTRLFSEGFVAYGEKDRRWKYDITETWSLNHKSIYSYPFHFIQANYYHDTRNPGQDNEFAQNNRFLYSFSRGLGGLWLYSDVLNLSYVREFGNHFSWNFGMKYWQQTPAGNLYYIYSPNPAQPDTVQRLTSAQLSATFGWAPHQVFYQGLATRRSITTKYPVFTLQIASGIKGFLGGQFNYNAFHLNISKRIYLAPIGFTNIAFDAGYITGNLPFPLLVIHPANSAYYYSFNSYNLMNTAEFVSDHYAGLNMEHFFGGFFLNKIPALKRLRLREVIAGKILFGGVRDENNPALNPAQMKFPALNDGVHSTYVLGSQPYLEGSIGIYNIFNILRLDFVKRFTYLDHPGISTTGIRFSTGLNF